MMNGGLRFKTLCIMMVVTPFAVAIGRAVEDRLARPKGSIKEKSALPVDPDEPLRYDQATKDEWKRKREVHFAKSAARLEKHEAALQVEKEERKALIESLEDQLVELQNTKIEPPPSRTAIGPHICSSMSYKSKQL